MSWHSLKNDIGAKPPVLAGPILRKVDEMSVTVWLALQAPCTVTLTILDVDGSVRLTGQRHTVAIGPLLHIVAVTADKLPPLPITAALVEDVVYRYDLSFAFDGGGQMNLKQATNNAPLTYGSLDRPSFCLPPSDIRSLRLMCGSCRKAHGHGPDSLPLLDDLITQTAAIAAERPHQLLLMGDQIYADDVAASLLHMVTDASEVLLNTNVAGRSGWQELLPLPPSTAVPGIPNSFPVPGGQLPAAQLPAYMRRPILSRIGFSSEDLDAHLMSLGEYICMYLFAWSDVLWPSVVPGSSPPTLDVPAFADVNAWVMAHAAPGSRWRLKLLEKSAEITREAERVSAFGSTVPMVRRVLANIPTYMILDDHEVTDDWNMTKDICAGQVGTPLGLRIVQNAVVAYAVCQHWGNCPEQFLEGNTLLSGTKLLEYLDGQKPGDYETNSPSIQIRVAVHDLATINNRPFNPPFAVFHDPNSLIYNYTIVGPAHQIIVTDTRTWREFPRGGGGAPDLLPASQIQAQIAQSPNPGNRVLIVVLSTNAPPVEFIRSSTRHPRLSNLAQHYPDIFESWEIPAVATDRLYKAITDKLPLVNGERHGGAIILSGDVHSGFASRLLFTGTARFEDPAGAGQPVSAVIAQLIASALRNQNTHTIDQHGDGYNYAPTGEGIIVPNWEPEGYAGWNLPVGSGQNVGSVFYTPMFTTSIVATDLLLNLPTVPVEQNGFKIRASRQPDYGYRLDYLRANAERITPPIATPLPPIPAGATAADRQAAANAFRVVTGNYRDYNKNPVTDRQVVGFNNIGEVTFDVDAAGNRRVNHTLRWRDPRIPQLIQLSNYAVSLDPNDPAFPYSAVAPDKAP